MSPHCCRVATDIKHDKAGLKEIDDRVASFRGQQDVIQTRVHNNTQWAEAFDTNIGCLQKDYSNMGGDMEVLYQAAKCRHQDGIGVLKETFGYHPEFKKYNGKGRTFTASAFTPK